VLKAIAEKNFSKKIDILHWIIPREKREAGKEDILNMPFESKWIEIGEKHLIKESGYHEFPVAVGRFMKQPGEVHGDSLAMEAIADIRMLNAEQKTLIRGAMKAVDPPQDVPSRGYQMPLNLNPSGINYRDATIKAADGMRPILTGANIGIGIELIDRVTAAIEKTFFVPLFQAFSQLTKQMTIPEVNRRIGENMVLLGPVVGRFTQEVLDPALTRLFNMLMRNGRLPEPPEIMAGHEFDIIYISQLAKAQRHAEILSLEKTLLTVGDIAQFIPEVLDKINADEAVDLIAEINGVDPKIIRDDEAVREIRELRMIQQEQEEEQMALAQAAETIAKTSEAEKNLKAA
jgi:hypothetical protein